MAFNSFIFALAFLPVCVAGYFALNKLNNKDAGIAFLLVMSLCFYAYSSLECLGLLLLSICVNYAFHTDIVKNTDSGRRKAVLVISLVFNIGLLLYFKYCNFFIDNIRLVFKVSISERNIIVPLGISFFTFSQISFIIDTYRGDTARCGFLNYALFVAFFPKMVAGPIVMSDSLIPQFDDGQRKTVSWDNISSGLFLFSMGLAKKVILADTFGAAADIGFSVVGWLNPLESALTMLFYTIQIYFDFSGYSDMALAVAKMLNFDLPVNFNSPYKSLTIVDFWKRWHISLTKFFTRYLYIPLGGNRNGRAKTIVNTLIVFLVSGFWHGANWTFVVWGLAHGLFYALTKTQEKFFRRIPSVINWIITFTFVNCAWTVFRAETIPEAFTLISKAFTFRYGGGIRPDIFSCFTLPEFSAVFGSLLGIDVASLPLCMIGFLAASALIILLFKNAKELADGMKPGALTVIATVFLLCWSVFSFYGVTNFVYAKF